ncbi:MAG: hypothetical protein C0412_17505, partial [Flavobacterium sp.]|nr:hypothetical protein [Flavobacterium sp.]
MQRQISVIVPCYNEEESIGQVIDLMPKEIFEVIVVDNNCTDKTAEIAQQKGARVVKEPMRGYGMAIRKGFEKSKGDILVVLDGDAQYPADKILEALNYLDQNKLDFVSCSRLPLKNRNVMPFTRRFGNKIFNMFTNVLFCLKLRDSQSGMWVFKKEVLDKIPLIGKSMPLSEEIKIRASKHPDIKFAEYAIDYRERFGDSKLFPLKHGIINLLFLFKLRFLLWWQDKQFRYFHIGLLIALVIFLAFAFHNIKDPFIHVTSDTNGQNGIAAVNFVKHGIFNMKFGIRDLLLSDLSGKIPYYTHHPSFFAVPTFIFYKLFGISELTTRMGPLSLVFLSMIIFAYALRRIFDDIWPALVGILIFGILPGLIFYGKTFELAVFSLPNSLITFS